MIEKYQDYKWKLLVGGIVVILLIVFYVSRQNTSFTYPNEEQFTTIDYTKGTQGYVDIKGEIQKPGVYAITENMRLKDLIDLAGGFTLEAAVEQVNLAQLVTDEMVIMIPNRAQVNNVEQETTTKINLNTATKEQLMSIKGIGEKKALLIIDYRQKHGRFKKIEDLGQIKGFSETFIHSLKAFVSVL